MSISQSFLSTSERQILWSIFCWECFLISKEINKGTRSPPSKSGKETTCRRCQKYSLSCPRSEKRFGFLLQDKEEAEEIVLEEVKQHQMLKYNSNLPYTTCKKLYLCHFLTLQVRFSKIHIFASTAPNLPTKSDSESLQCTLSRKNIHIGCYSWYFSINSITKLIKMLEFSWLTYESFQNESSLEHSGCMATCPLKLKLSLFFHIYSPYACLPTLKCK